MQRSARMCMIYMSSVRSLLSVHHRMHQRVSIGRLPPRVLQQKGRMQTKTPEHQAMYAKSNPHLTDSPLVIGPETLPASVSVARPGQTHSYPATAVAAAH